MIKSAVLQVKENGRERLDSDEPIECECRGGVMCAIMKRRYVRLVPILVAVHEKLPPARIESAYWF